MQICQAHTYSKAFRYIFKEYIFILLYHIPQDDIKAIQIIQYDV